MSEKQYSPEEMIKAILDKQAELYEASSLKKSLDLMEKDENEAECAANEILGDKSVDEVMEKLSKDKRSKVLSKLKAKDTAKAEMCKSFMEKSGDFKFLGKTEELKRMKKEREEKKKKTLNDKSKLPVVPDSVKTDPEYDKDLDPKKGPQILKSEEAELKKAYAQKAKLSPKADLTRKPTGNSQRLRDSNEKGVHTRSFAGPVKSGQSTAGHHTRNPELEPGRAKAEHKEKLQELKNMPKPKLAKARAEEGMRPTDKKAIRSERKREDGPVKGVNRQEPGKRPGTSEGGDWAREMRVKSPSSKKIASRQAEYHHQKTLSEMKQMPKPKLAKKDESDNTKMERTLGISPKRPMAPAQQAPKMAVAQKPQEQLKDTKEAFKAPKPKTQNQGY